MKPLAIRPYNSRPTHDLIYVATVLTQMSKPIPVDLAAALNERGIAVSDF
jgi:hypothetical protein